MIVDGKKISSLIKEDIKKQIKDNSLEKSLAIFYVGENKIIDQFISVKNKFGTDVGIKVDVLKYSEDVTEDFLIEEIENKSPQYSGVVVQLPLPKSFNQMKILNSIPLDKDVDFLSDRKNEVFKKGDMAILPPVAGAVYEIFDFYDVDLKNKNIVVVGKGFLVGRPVIDLLKILGIQPTVVDIETENKSQIYKDADIIISGVGFPNLIKKEDIKDGCILIDAGTSSHKGVISGDISPDCLDKASLLSPVPGGVGPITVAVLFRNVLYN